MKILKKSFILLVFVAGIFMSSTKSIAATNCMDVRDYGYHRYNQMHNVTITRIMVWGATGSGYIHSTRYEHHCDVCVCGLSRSYDDSHEVYSPISGLKK